MEAYYYSVEQQTVDTPNLKIFRVNIENPLPENAPYRQEDFVEDAESTKTEAGSIEYFKKKYDANNELDRKHEKVRRKAIEEKLSKSENAIEIALLKAELKNIDT